jgi:hypothetical protein
VWIVVDPPHSGYAAASINSIIGEHWLIGVSGPTLCLELNQSPGSEMMPQVVPQNPQKLCELAAWYRECAERAATPWVNEGRLQTAADLERTPRC